MEKREKIFIVIATVIILLAVFIAFIVSNSQKVPPEILVKNADKKTANATLGGYEWKVFGNTILADGLELETAEYKVENTIISKTREQLTISTVTEENFTIQGSKFVDLDSMEVIETPGRLGDTGNYFNINSPEKEGIYACIFKLGFYDKGSAEYGVKVVVTDVDVYEVKDIISYKNTKISDVKKINEILKKLPYNENLKGITINCSNVPYSISIKYDNNIQKEDLYNGSVAVFALIPEVESVIYKINNEEIYYSRGEINNLTSRNVLEYVDNVELWTKEIIYKEYTSQYNNDITIYSSVITTALAESFEKEIGEYVAIDISQNNTSGEILLNENDVKTLLEKLNLEYEIVLNVDSNNFDGTSGTLVTVQINEKVEWTYIVNAIVKNANGKIVEKKYKATQSGDTTTILPYEDIKSGE